MSNAKINTYTMTVTGNTAVSTADTGSGVPRGKVLSVYIDYSAGSLAATDVTLVDGDGQAILTESNSKTDVTRYPRKAVEDNTGTTVTYDGTNEIYEPYIVMSHFTTTVAQNDAAETVTVRVRVEEY